VVGKSCSKKCLNFVRHNIQVLNMDDLYVDNPRNQTSITNLHYYHINLFYTIIDMQL
jgi:hypothetical protein